MCQCLLKIRDGARPIARRMAKREMPFFPRSMDIGGSANFLLTGGDDDFSRIHDRTGFVDCIHSGRAFRGLAVFDVEDGFAGAAVGGEVVVLVGLLVDVVVDGAAGGGDDVDGVFEAKFQAAGVGGPREEFDVVDGVRSGAAESISEFVEIDVVDIDAVEATAFGVVEALEHDGADSRGVGIDPFFTAPAVEAAAEVFLRKLTGVAAPAFILGRKVGNDFGAL